MIGEDRVVTSGTELRRVHVVRQVLDQRITQVKAGTLMGLTNRQIRRLMRRVAQEGDQGLVYRGCGKPSNRRSAEPVKTQALTLYAERDGDLGPTLAAEKLAGRHGIAVSAETLRGWLLAQGVTHFFGTRRRPQKVRRSFRQPSVRYAAYRPPM
jgi:hypothetical protein